jgi:hypothetical protein
MKRLLVLILLLLPLPVLAAPSAMELALQLVNTDAAQANFEEYATRFTQTQNDMTDKMVAAAQTDDLKHAFETQLPKVTQLKVELLNTLAADMPAIYAQIFTERFSQGELEIMANATRSDEDRAIYDRSPIAAKAADVMPQLDALAQQRLIEKFKAKLDDKAFVAEVAKISDQGLLDLTESMRKAGEKDVPVRQLPAYGPLRP